MRRGHWWTLLVWKDHFVGAERKRKRERVRLAPSTMSEREVLKIAAEHLRPLNQGLESIGSATNFNHYIETVYLPVVMPLMAKSTQGRSQGVLNNYLSPTFGKLCLRDLTPLTIQRYFSEMATSNLSHESRDKIRDVLSSVLHRPSSTAFLCGIPLRMCGCPQRGEDAGNRSPISRPRNLLSCLRPSLSPTPRWYSLPSTQGCA